MLRWRLLIGCSIISLLAALCWADANAHRPGIYLTPLALVLCVLATREMLGLFRAQGRQPIAWSTYLGTLLPVLGACAPIVWLNYPEDCPVGKLGWLACGLAAGIIFALVAELRRFNQSGQTITNLSATVLSILYVGGLLGFLIELRLLHDNHWGMVALLSLIGTVKLSDTCQYIFGNLFGKRKLASEISPGKTWEGTIYGIVVGVAIACSILWYFISREGNQHNFLGVILYCFLVSIAGVIGDLSESMLKRDAGVKDSSSWLPGLGGILDLLDSLLVAAPVAYFCWVVGLIGP